MFSILTLMSDPNGQAFVESVLAKHDISSDDERLGHSGLLDIVIVDLPMLDRWHDEISACRDADAPTALPVLLMLSRHEFSQVNDALRSQVDDVIILPLECRELEVRVDNLIRMRELSKSLERRIADSDSELRALGRTFSLFSACNELILRAESEEHLFESTLREMVNNRGFRFAWVGLAQDDENKSIEVVAKSGDADAYLDNVNPTWRAGPLGDGPAGRAIREQKAQVCDDLQDVPHFTPWLENAREFGFASCLVLPCAFDEEREGIVALYADLPHAFTCEEVELMKRLSENIAFGVKALRDRDALKAEKQNAEKRAYRDVLTGLPNRQWFQERLSTLDVQADRHSRYAAVLFVDLDGFKRINDTSGHEVGDRLLHMVARRLQGLVREEDFIARQGGDEFVILMPFEVADGKDYSEADQHAHLVGASSHVAKRIVTGMRKPFSDGHNDIYLGASVGISLFPHDAKDASSLPSLADQAMYEAKHQGGNQFQFYSAKLLNNLNHQMELERDLFHAVESGGFELHYQPIVDLETGQVEAVEALLRWPQSDNSTVAPEAFLSVLEERGWIIRVSEWVLRQACEDLVEARRQWPDLRLSLNLSVRELWHPGMPRKIANAVRRAGLPADALELEVTEASLMSDVVRMEKVVHELNRHGFSVAIDDYGTGYSSMSRLVALPISTLKLDGSFLRGLSSSPGAAAMIGAIAEMTPKLQLRLVAEGIESDEQRDFLTNLGCRTGQGYLFNRPMPFDALMRYLTCSTATS